MPLSSLAVSRAKPKDKAYKLVDEHGLCLLVTPKGGRYWRFNYRFGGKWRTLALGVYPEVTLAAARAKRDEARQMRLSGSDPVEDRKAKLAQAEFDATSTFKHVAEEWLAKREREGLGEVTLAKARWLLGFVYPELGSRKIGEITSLELLAVAHAGLGTQAMCQALMKQALVTLLRVHWLSIADGSLLTAAVNHPRLARAVAAIIEHPGARHTVDSLAELAGMSRASFSDHFSRTFGQGPIEFVQRTRLRVAARLLNVTDLPVKAVAASVGYAGSRPFSRAFETAFGVLPTRYREQPDRWS